MKTRTKRIWWAVSATFALLICLIVASSFFMLDYSLKPVPNGGKDVKVSYQALKDEYPYIVPWLDSLKEEHALRDTFMVFPHGRKMHALYAFADQPTGKTAILVHGYKSSAVRMLMVGYIYHHLLGYNMLLPDLHHHGESDGEAVQMGWKDRKDVMLWMEVANNLFKQTDPATGATIPTDQVLHGISMGAFTIMSLSGEDNVPYVKAYIDDCGYNSVWDEFSTQLNQQFGLPDFPLMYSASLLCKLKYGWSFQEADAVKQVRKCKLPMLFIHGDADTYNPTWMVYPLYEAKPEPKELWIAPGSAHAKNLVDHREEYTRIVQNFVEKYVR